MDFRKADRIDVNGKGNIIIQDTGGSAIEINTRTDGDLLADVMRNLPTMLMTKFSEWYQTQIKPNRFITRLPSRPPLQFTGRGGDQKAVEKILEEESILVLYGNRGMGKTTLAKDFFHRAMPRYDILGWINCPNGIVEGIIKSEIEDQLNIAIRDADDWAGRFSRVWTNLPNITGKHLLVLDNVNEAEEIRKLLTRLPHWHILVTSTARTRSFPRHEVKPLPKADAKRMFLSYCDEQRVKGQEGLAARLVNAVDKHTLLLELLAKTLNASRRYTLPKLCEELEQRGVLHFRKRVESPYRKDRKVNVQEMMEELFQIASLSEHDTHWLQLICLLPASTPYTFEEFCELFQIEPGEEEAFEEALEVLTERGWLDWSDDSYRPLQLVQQFVMDRHSPEAGQALRLIGLVKEKLEQAPLGEAIAYLGYAENLLQHFADQPNRELAELFAQGSLTGEKIGRLDVAVAFAAYVIRFFQSQSNTEDQKELAWGYQQLGDLKKTLGKFPEALSLYRKAEAILAPLYRDNPQSESLKNGLAISYERLGDIYKAQGKMEPALDYYEKETNLFEELYRDNPFNAELENNLAISYRQLGDLHQELEKKDQAVARYTKAIQVWESLCDRVQLPAYKENLKNVRAKLAKLEAE